MRLFPLYKYQFIEDTHHGNAYSFNEQIEVSADIAKKIRNKSLGYIKHVDVFKRLPMQLTQFYVIPIGETHSSIPPSKLVMLNSKIPS